MSDEPRWGSEVEDPIKVWRFFDAPKQYQDLSPHGGDEDWIALVPNGINRECIFWAEEGTAFGRCSVSVHELMTGETVLIGAHA